MSDLLNSEPKGKRWRVSAGVALTAAAILLVAAIGVFEVFRFVDALRERDLRTWQDRLGLVADSRKAAVEAWLGQQWQDLGDVADSDSVRLFLTQVKLAGGDVSKVQDGEAQAEYLQNMLIVRADGGGFKAPVLGPEVPADIQRTGLAGMEILDLDGKVLVMTRSMPAVDLTTHQFIAAAAKAQRAERDIFLDPAQQPAMGFLVPIYAVQGDAVADQQVGWVYGVKEVAAELYPKLKQPGDIATAEAVLVRQEGAVIRYLSPLQGDRGLLSLALATNTPELDAASAVAAPGGFDIKRDYRNIPVLFISRKIEGAPWVLLYTVDRETALGPSDRRARDLLTVFLLAILLLTAAIIAIWRHGASQRASESARRYRELALRFEHQGNFLRLVTDSQPNVIFIADENSIYRFANRKAAEEAGISSADMMGKTLAAVLGPDIAKRFERLNRTALEDEKMVSGLHRTGSGRTLRVLQSEHIPLTTMPDIVPRGVLVVEQDVTVAVAERERRERTLAKLVKSLVSLVDRRDRYAADHSARVATVAHAIATEMGLDPTLVESAEIAGNLMNLGKILVPVDILTKEGRLSEEEIEHVRDSLDATADFLEGIEFDGPVVETLRQSRENWDGSGRPRGLAGEAILPTARAVAVANAFVAMVSPRLNRPGLDMNAVVE
ncbi:MAG TPA: HD domain-containing phosphohydrolase, partial [Thermoanaerobaculia bacterium]|nr:HD domain-containing phosphohydrolase [Thermoanaerobaculia bacterium]